MRVSALDILRGMAVALMVMVNCPGSWTHMYDTFRHAKDSGIHVADLVFPMFLWSVGFSMYCQFESSYGRSNNGSKIENFEKPYLKIGMRGVLLIVLGLALSLFGSGGWDTIRIPGILQRIGLIYFAFLPLLFFYPKWKYLIVVSLGITCLGYLNLHLTQDYRWSFQVLEQEDTWFAMVDRTLIGVDHLWKQTKNYDPEGVLSTLPAFLTSLHGFFYAKYRKHSKTLMWWMGFTLAIAALSSVFFPIRKDDWTLSYASWTAFGICLLFLVLEKKPHWFGRTGFSHLGRHALFSFVFLGLVGRIPIFAKGRAFVFTQISSFLDPKLSSFVYSVFIVSILWVFVYFWDRFRSQSKPRHDLKT